MSSRRSSKREDPDSFKDENGKFADKHFKLNAKGYIVFNQNLVIDSRYRLQQEIILDETTGTTAKGRYGSVFRVLDLQDGLIKALKINRIPPEEEDAKRQAAKDYLKQQQTQSTPSNEKAAPIMSLPPNHPNNQMHKAVPSAPPDHHGNGTGSTAHYAHHKQKQPPPPHPEPQPAPKQQAVSVQPAPQQHHHHHRRRRVKTVKERYKSSCKREIGVLKRVTRKNQGELIPCLVLYDYGEYLGHTYMIFPVYDMPLQQHLVNTQKYQDSVQKKQLHDTPNPPNTAPNNALVHPEDLWAFEEQLISALSYIHNVCHVMHLDFKPKNIMINCYGYDIQKYAKNLHLVKLKKNAITLIDFSVSAKAPKKANLDEVRYTGNFGTRRYRPPEMIYGGKWNRSVDTYGTAMIILECIKLFPIIDTTYYKKKKILKFKKKIKNAHQLTVANKKHHDRLHREQDHLNGTNKGDEVAARLSPPPPKLNSGYKQLDISEVLYLIMQQIGFPEKEYWQNLATSERALFPRHPLIENIRRKGKRSKLFDNDGFERKSNDEMNGKGGTGGGGHGDDVVDEDDSEDCSDDEDFMPWSSFSEQLKGHRGIAWNLFKHYGSNLIETMKLDKMEESLRRMMVWDPRLRIRPEQCLQDYFPKSDRHSDLFVNDEMEDDF